MEMKTQYNYQRQYRGLTKTEEWDEIGYLSDPNSSVTPNIDPAKNYEIEIDIEYADNLDNTIHVSKTTTYTEIKPPLAEGSADPEVTENSVSQSLQLIEQQLGIEDFRPYWSIVKDSGDFLAFMAGQLICRTNAETSSLEWFYPKGVAGITEKQVTVDATWIKYKTDKEKGMYVKAWVPAYTTTIVVTAKYDGDITDYETGIPSAVKSLAESETQYKPSGVTTAHAVFGLQKIPGGVPCELVYAGSSISMSANASSKLILEGGVLKTKVQYTITKNWLGIASVPSESGSPSLPGRA